MKFGYDFSQMMAKLFLLDEELPFPYFEVKDGVVQQNMPLRLRNKVVEKQLFKFLQNVDIV